MAETLRIEIPIETIDKTDPGLSKITKNFERMEKAADSASSSAKKAEKSVSAFDKQANRTERSLSRWAKEKYKIMLEAKDKISPLLLTLGPNLRKITGKSWNVTMRAVDFITSPLRGIMNMLRNPVFQAGAVLGVGIGLKDTIDTYKNFEASMSQVQAVSGATRMELVKLTDKAKEMGATTKFTAEESSQAFNYMAMAGWKTGDMLNGIEGILSLAAASGTDLATTSDIVTDALTAFNMKASDAARFSDVMAAASSNANTNVMMMGETFKYAGAMAGTLGYSIEDVALMTALMANSGIKATMSGTALNMIFTRLSTNTGDARDALSELGIEFFDSAGKARDLSEVMGELRLATASMNDEQKSNIANTIAGAQAQKGLLAILNASEADYRKLQEAIENSDGAAKKMSSTMMNNLQGSLTLLQSAVDGVKISFGERLSPYLKSFAEWLIKQMPGIEKGLDEFMDWVDLKTDKMKRKMAEITETAEWQDSGFFGKARILWDKFITEPFFDWWKSKGKAQFSTLAGDIGKGIGTGIKIGVMAMLGLDIEKSFDEGASIGKSFAKGFSDGLDFGTVSSGLLKGVGNLFSSASNLLPGGESAGLSSLLSAVFLGKLIKPVFGFGKGAFALGTSGLGGAFLGSAAMGTGLLGRSAMTAIALGGGNLAGGASLGGASLSALGLGAGAGALIGGATLISSGIDAYKAFRSDNKDEQSAYAKSAGWKAGGLAFGAAAGAAIGSIIPGIGTAIGALIGAGAGSIAGWINGNRVKEEYQKNAEEMRLQADKAKKIYEITGLSMENMRFKTKALQDAMKDGEVSAEQFGAMFQEEVENVTKNAFGNIKLSLNEVKNIAKEITFGEMAEGLIDFRNASNDTLQAFSNLQSSISALKKENWRVSLDMNLDEMERDKYKSSVENFIKDSQAYIDNNHYEATVALKLLTGSGANSSGLDGYYSSLNEQLNKLGSGLKGKVNLALEDGVITLNESEEILNLQNQIEAITGKISKARMDSEFESLKIKYSGANLDASSFEALQEEFKALVSESSKNYDQALTLTLTNLKLQLADGAITEEQYSAMVNEATKGYRAQISEINARVSSFNLETIAEAWGDQLDGYMPEIEKTTAEKLEMALNNALRLHPDVSGWKEGDVVKWMGLDKLDLALSEQAAISRQLLKTAQAVPQETKDKFVQSYSPLLNGIFEQLKIDWAFTGSGLANALNTSISSGLAGYSPMLRTLLQSALSSATSSPFSINPAISVNPSYNISSLSTDLPSLFNKITGKATGGYVSGGPKLSWLAEEGWGEFIIPTNPSRRADALKLYQQAGRMLGVQNNASGGYVNGLGSLDNKLLNGALNNGAYGGNEATEDSNGATNLVSPRVGQPGSVVQVSVNMSPAFNVSGESGKSETEIMETIRRHMREIADELGGEIAEKLGEVFSNMPVKGV